MATISGNMPRRKRRVRSGFKNSFCPAEEETLRVLHRFDQGIRAMKQYGPQSTFLGSLLTYSVAMEGDYRATLAAEATMYNVTAGLLLTIALPAFLYPNEEFDQDTNLFRTYMYFTGIAFFLTLIALICSVHLVATGFGGYACAGDLSAFVFKSSYHGHAFEAKMINGPLMGGMAAMVLAAGVNAIMVMNIMVDGAVLCGLVILSFFLGIIGWQCLVDWHLKLVRISDFGMKAVKLHWSTELNSQYTWFWRLPSLFGGSPVTFRERSAQEMGGTKMPFTCGGLVALSTMDKEMITTSTNMTEFHAIGMLRNLSKFYDIEIPEPQGVFGTKHFPGGLYRWISTWEMKPVWKKRVYGANDGGLSLFVNQSARNRTADWAEPMPTAEHFTEAHRATVNPSFDGFDTDETEEWSSVMKAALGTDHKDYCKMLNDVDLEKISSFGVSDIMSILKEAGIESLGDRIKIAAEIA